LVVRAVIYPVTEAADGPVTAIEQAARVPATEQVEAEEIVSEDGISRAVVAVTGMLSAEVPKVTADQALALTAVAVRRAWDLEVEVEGVAAAAVGDAGRRPT
jgi:hypothetical protein